MRHVCFFLFRVHKTKAGWWVHRPMKEDLFLIKQHISFSALWCWWSTQIPPLWMSVSPTCRKGTDPVASYTLWQKSAKTMICLNLSFATATSCLVPLRRPVSWGSGCGHDSNIYSFQSDFLFCVNTVFRLLSGNELLSLQNKKARNKSAAVQFVKKNWGESKHSTPNVHDVHTNCPTGPETSV